MQFLYGFGVVKNNSGARLLAESLTRKLSIVGEYNSLLQLYLMWHAIVAVVLLQIHICLGAVIGSQYIGFALEKNVLYKNNFNYKVI